MKFGGLLVALQCAGALAYTITGGTVSVGKNKIEVGEFGTAVVRQLFLGPKDKIDVSLQLSGLGKRPHQTVVTIGNDAGLEHSILPAVSTSEGTVKAAIPIGSLPGSIRIQDKLFLKVIVADAQSGGDNVYRTLVELIPLSSLKEAANYKGADRIGLKPEIHHVFKDDPTTVSPAVPYVFILGIAALLLGYLAVTGVTLNLHILGHFKDISGAQFLHDFAFFVCLAGYEATFVRYYLGSSIFTTIFYSAVLAGPSIYFGSRVFRDLAKFRKIGK